MLHFPQGLVISNEHDPLRFHFLHHHMDLVRIQLGNRSAEQQSRMGSVLNMWSDEGEGVPLSF